MNNLRQRNLGTRANMPACKNDARLRVDTKKLFYVV